MTGFILFNSIEIESSCSSYRIRVYRSLQSRFDFMNILLNGAPHEIADDLCLADLIAQLDLIGQRFAVEVNAELVPRSRFAECHLISGDRVEIIQAVGGG